MPNQSVPRFQKTIEVLLIFIIAGCAYLPNLTRASIYRDDWYYAMDRLIGGPNTFQEMFSIDRPARAPLFEVYFQLFNVQPLPYHISSFIWRILGGFAALYLFNFLWPGKRKMALFLALLFTLFPGYSRWLEGFENQPRIISSFLEVLSIALTIKAIQADRKLPKTLAWFFSILSGWAYIALVDFSIGMEFFRLLAVFIYIHHNYINASFIKKIMSTLQAWAIAAAIPIGFLYWRLFIFHNQRPTTDINLQMSFLFDSPIHTGLLWLIRLFQSTVNVAALAWAMPTAQTLFNFRVTDILFGIFLAFLAILVFIIGDLATRKIESANNLGNLQETNYNYANEAIIIGLAGIIVGVLPVIAANRYVTLGNYSHYALPASLAGAVLIGGLVFSIRSINIRLASMAGLVLLAVLTHYTISLRITQEETIVSSFWQQVVWRAPGIQPKTTLFVNYPSVDYGQDVDTVAGPANYLYFPNNTNQLPAIYQLSALEQGDPSSKDILANPNNSYTFRYRTHESLVNYANLLVISQPTEFSCVHILDSNQPQLTRSDPYFISQVAHLSKIDRIIIDSTAPQPAKSIFGHEPDHGWCYYYQKAELSLQNNDWKQILVLGNEVTKRDLHPDEVIEWLPFLQAYAISGDINSLNRLAKQVKKDSFSQKQACLVLSKLKDKQPPPSIEIQNAINQIFCGN